MICQYWFCFLKPFSRQLFADDNFNLERIVKFILYECLDQQNINKKLRTDQGYWLTCVRNDSNNIMISQSVYQVHTTAHETRMSTNLSGNTKPIRCNTMATNRTLREQTRMCVTLPRRPGTISSINSIKRLVVSNTKCL